jgi:Tfp pilus assembly protein PilP
MAIRDNEMLINEIVQDPSGQSADWVERQTTLQLQDSLKGEEISK